MLVYHGGYNPVDQPTIRRSRFPKDFGPGFYCTELKEQAIRWAKRFDTPIVSIYVYVPRPDLDVLSFKEMTEAWLDFIVACRSGTDHRYDIVNAAMANDQIFNYIADYLAGILTREQFWVLAKFKHPTHQLAFCSERALDSLRYMGIAEVRP